MLDKKITPEQLAVLVEDLHGMSVVFRDKPMSKDQLKQYLFDLTNYHGFTYDFDGTHGLRKAIARARQRFQEPGEVLPKPRFIMDMINPNAS